MPDIKQLCNDFYNSSLTKKYVIYRKSVFSEIDTYCNENVDKIKHEVYCNRTRKTDYLLDRHKVAAIHVIAVLKKRLFLSQAQPNNTTFMDMLANEHCALLLMSAILIGWHESEGEYVDIDIPLKYKDNLLMLFGKYVKSQSSPIMDNVFVYSLANIVYLIESKFLKRIRAKGSLQSHYKP